MDRAPEFCRDWQTMPVLSPLSSNGPPPPATAVRGGLLGMLIAATIPAEQVISVLPAGVELPPHIQPGDPYPISIAFGFQHQVGLARFPRLPGADYLEFAVGIADLQLQKPIEGFAGPCAILGRLDLNELLPIVLGRLLGLQKVLRLARTDEDAFGLRSFWRRSTVAYGSLHRLNGPHRASELPALAPLIRTFAQPIVSRPIFGTLAFTRFTWKWDQGLAQEASCDLTIARGLGQGRYMHPSSDPSTAVCSGAWQIRVPWVMEAFQRPGSFVTPVTAGAPTSTRGANASPVPRPG
jgi:hypothetical protein